MNERTLTTETVWDGRLDLVFTDNGLETVRLENAFDAAPNSALKTVFVDGELFNETTLTDVRARAQIKMKQAVGV